MLVLFILYVNVDSSVSTKVVEVNVICKEASNPSYCINLLNSKPKGAKGVDLVHLAYYTIAVLNNNCTNTVNLLSELVKSANYYQICSDELSGLDSVRSRIGDAKFNLDRINYYSVAGDSEDIKFHVNECFISLPQDKKTSLLLTKYLDVIRQGGQVLQIIAKYLNQ